MGWGCCFRVLGIQAGTGARTRPPWTLERLFFWLLLSLRQDLRPLAPAPPEPLNVTLQLLGQAVVVADSRPVAWKAGRGTLGHELPGRTRSPVWDAG